MRLHYSLATALMLTAAPTLAEGGSGGNFFDGKHVLGIGAAYQEADAEVRASVASLPEVGLDLDDLGMEDSDTSWAIEYRWRFAERWVLSGMAYTFDESGQRTANRDFNFDGNEYSAGAVIDTELGLDTYIVNLLYQVYKGDSTELLLGGGLHAFDLDTSIEGRAFVGDLNGASGASSSELLAPLPNLRAQAFFTFSDRWSGSLSLGWLSANYGDYDGSFIYAHPRLAYQLGEHWAATLGYQYVNIDLTQEKSSRRELALDATFTGPTVYLHYRF